MIVRLAGIALSLAASLSTLGRAEPDVPGNYIQTLWTTDNGLPQNSVNAIVQTHDGYLWLGTYGGLVRFDGVRFTTFNTVNKRRIEKRVVLTVSDDGRGMEWEAVSANASRGFG